MGHVAALVMTARGTEPERAAEAILQRLRRVAAASLGLDLPAAELAALTRLDDVAGVDSLTVLEFVAGIEAEFAIRLSSEDLRVELLTDLPRLAEHLARRSAEPC